METALFRNTRIDMTYPHSGTVGGSSEYGEVDDFDQLGNTNWQTVPPNDIGSMSTASYYSYAAAPTFYTSQNLTNNASGFNRIPYYTTPATQPLSFSSSNTTINVSQTASWAQDVSYQDNQAPRAANDTRPWRFVAEGVFNRRYVEALADFGSSHNVVSQRFARSLKLAKSGSPGVMQLPNGTTARTLGRTEGVFSFASEAETYRLVCVIMERCTHDLVLGSDFLKMTDTLKVHNKSLRLKKVFSQIPTIGLLGFGQDFLHGYLNMSSCLALPDTGSELMVMSESYAIIRDLEIQKDERHRVEFMDGSTARTHGMVRGVQWQFTPDGQPSTHDFHIIRDLLVDAILSSQFLEDFEIFSNYEHLLQPAHIGGGQGVIYGISLAKKPKAQRNNKSLEDQAGEDREQHPTGQSYQSIPVSLTKHLATVNTSEPFSPYMKDRELARRDEIEGRISRLPEHLQGAERAKEAERIRQWEERERMPRQYHHAHRDRSNRQNR